MGILIGQEKEQRSLDLNTAKCMLGLLLGKTWPLFPVFNQFLEVSTIFTNFPFFFRRLFLNPDPELLTHLFNLKHSFVTFQQSKYKVINKDQWCNVLEFSRTINLDLSNYDEDGACE